MRQHMHVTLAAVFLTFRVALIVNGLAIPLSARGTDPWARRGLSITESEPAPYVSLDKRVFDFGTSGSDLFDVVSQVLTKPHDSAQDSTSAIAHSPTPSPQLHQPEAKEPPLAPKAEPSGQLRQLRRPSWMSSKTKFGLTPDRLTALQSDEHVDTEELIDLLHKSLTRARANVFAAESAGNAEKTAAWLTKHNADFAIREAAYARLNNEDAITAEQIAEAKFHKLQSDTGSTSTSHTSLPFVTRGRLYAAAAGDGGAKARGQIATYGTTPEKRRWYYRESDTELSKSPAASAKDAEDIISSNAATRLKARKRIETGEARLLRAQNKDASETSAAQQVSTGAAEQDERHATIHIPFDWEH